jgi:hypothetical protein
MVTIKQVPPPEPPRPEPTYTLEGVTKVQLQVVKGLLGRLNGEIDASGAWGLYNALGGAQIREDDGPFKLETVNGTLKVSKR